jgi:uncharacterized damage-inducible protein DinB
MKLEDTLTTLFKHHRWANLQLLECCAGLTPEQLDTTMVGAFGSIGVTLEHITSSEKSYFSRISTGKRYDRPENAAPMTMAEMEASLRETGTGLIEWASKLKADDIVEVDWEGTPRATPKNILLTQALFHAAEHREQIKTMLTQMGVEPPDLQGWEYFDRNYEFQPMP